MSLFKSKEERRIERDIQIRKGISRIKRQIAELEKGERDWLTKAKRAKQLGSMDQFAFMKASLRRTATAKRMLQRQLLTIEAAAQMKNQMESYADFAKAMGAVSKAVAAADKQVDLEKTQREFEKAMASAESMSARMDLFLDMSNDALASPETVGESDLIGDAELDALIDGQIAADEGAGVDAKIAAGLKEIESELGKNEG